MHKITVSLKQLFIKYNVFLLAITFPFMLSAHPHSWIDTNTFIQSNETHITALHMTWTFDEETTEYMVAGEDISPENKAKTLQLLADSVTSNMYNEHYFTYLYNEEENKSTPIRYKAARYPKFVQYKDKLVLSFEIPLSKPIAFKDKHFTLVIYDPTYYVDMSWINRDDIQLSENMKQKCVSELVEPTVSDAQRDYTMALAEDMAPDNGLGRIFSQQFKLHCK